MHGANSSGESLGTTASRVARRLLATGGNRVELLMLELAEERERVLGATLLAVGVGVLSILAGVALTLGLALVLWDHSPLLALGAMTLLYAMGAVVLMLRLQAIWRGWAVLPATLEEIRKDLAALDRRLEAGAVQPLKADLP